MNSLTHTIPPLSPDDVLVATATGPGPRLIIYDD